MGASHGAIEAPDLCFIETGHCRRAMEDLDDRRRKGFAKLTPFGALGFEEVLPPPPALPATTTLPTRASVSLLTSTYLDTFCKHENMVKTCLCLPDLAPPDTTVLPTRAFVSLLTSTIFKLVVHSQ